MVDKKIIVTQFAKSLVDQDTKGLIGLCSHQVQFFNPLYGYLNAEQVRALWELQKANGIQLFDCGMAEDLGDGYYKFGGKLRITKIRKRDCFHSIQFYFRIEIDKITEYSEGFSLHQLAKINNGFWGWLLGWNKYYQNNMKIKARKRLFDLMNQTNGSSNHFGS